MFSDRKYFEIEIEDDDDDDDDDDDEISSKQKTYLPTRSGKASDPPTPTFADN